MVQRMGRSRHLPSTELGTRLEQHRTELTACAYRMLGSSFEAEDAVQETMIRAWRGYERFEDARPFARGSTGSRRTSASTC